MVVGAVNRTNGGVIFGEGCFKGACPCYPIILPRLSRTYPRVVGVTSRNRDTAIYTMEAISYILQHTQAAIETDGCAPERLEINFGSLAQRWWKYG